MGTWNRQIVKGSLLDYDGKTNVWEIRMITTNSIIIIIMVKVLSHDSVWEKASVY